MHNYDLPVHYEPHLCATYRLAESDFVEADTTYNENSELMYQFNCSACDYVIMRPMPVARMRGSVKNANYETDLCLVNETRKNITVHLILAHHSKVLSLIGVHVMWRPHTVIGEDTCGRLLKGCSVHWVRLCQRVADNYHHHSKGRRLMKQSVPLLGRYFS